MYRPREIVAMTVLGGLLVLLAFLEVAWGASIEAPPLDAMIASEQITCPASLGAAYKDAYDQDGDGVPDVWVFGRMTGGSQKGPVLARMDMIRADDGSLRFAGDAIVMVNGVPREMTVLEMWGRYPHPCFLFERRGTDAEQETFVLPADAMPDDLLRLVNEFVDGE